jgi:hypothetical protein
LGQIKLGPYGLVEFIIERRSKMSWQFTVGLRVKGKADRMLVDAEDALIAALKAKADQPGATIMYARRSESTRRHTSPASFSHCRAIAANGCALRFDDS